jgi:hypothetical protein
LPYNYSGGEVRVRARVGTGASRTTADAGIAARIEGKKGKGGFEWPPP